MSRLLFINQYYRPDEAATAQLLEDLAKSLVREGHSVTVLCGRSRYSCAEPLKAGSFLHEGVKVERVGGTDWGRYRLPGRLADHMTFLTAARWRLNSLPRQDLVVVMTSPPGVGHLGRIYREQFGVPFVLWAQDIYPEVAERLGALRNPVLRSILRRQSSRIDRACARIVAPAEGMAAAFKGRGVAEEVLRVVPNWANLDEIRAGRVQDNPFREEQGWANDRVLMYSGNVGAAHDTEAMLALVDLLQKEDPSARFVLVGSTPRHARFMEEAKRRGIPRASWLPAQPRARLGELLGAADAHLVSQRPETEGLLFPSKFYGIVAAGRPVILAGSSASELGRQILDARLGAVVERGPSPAEIRRARDSLFMARDDGGAVSRIREWAERNASHRVRLPQMAAVLREALS